MRPICDGLWQFWSQRLQKRPERETHFPGPGYGWLEVNRTGKLPKEQPWTELLAGLPRLLGAAAPALLDIAETLAGRLFLPGDPTLADAILDRLVHNAYRITLIGESMRKRRAATTT